MSDEASKASHLSLVAREMMAINTKRIARRSHCGLPLPATFPIVGVGASAGGFEAFSEMLSALPADTGMAFAFIQHLDPARGEHAGATSGS